MDFKTSNTKNLLVTLIFNNPDLSLRRIMQLYGMKMALEHISMRELRTMFGSYNKRSWYRLVADMKDVALTQRSTPPNPFRVIRDCLEEFTAVERTVLF